MFLLCLQKMIPIGVVNVYSDHGWCSLVYLLVVKEAYLTVVSITILVS
jgi:hypothetical protein